MWQEAFVKAYRCFRQLRDRERFRAWLVRMTWWLALDRQRANGAPSSGARGHAAARTQPTRSSRGNGPLGSGRLSTAARQAPRVTILAGIEGHDVREVAVRDMQYRSHARFSRDEG
jgi:DNA-directed RNA polymerase specialized sigma24 family protein